MSDLDKRLKKRMRSQLRAFENGKVELSALISNLESLQSLLQNVSPSWRSEFLRAWGVLEELYSVSIVTSQKITNNEYTTLIDPAVLTLLQLTAAKTHADP
jgi:hypothetical protein